LFHGKRRTARAGETGAESGPSLSKCARMPGPGGEVVMAECFRTDADKGRSAQGPQPGSGHHLSQFRSVPDQSAFPVEAEPDITDAVAPSIDHARVLFSVIGHWVTRFAGEIKPGKPASHWFLTSYIAFFLPAQRRQTLMRRLTGTERNAKRFCGLNGVCCCDWPEKAA
jgi:hypothetical protein